MALTKVWEQERQWDLAVSTAAALNTKWSHKEKVVPFTPQDFLPKTPEQLKVQEEQEAKLRKAQQQFLSGSLRSLQASLRREQQAREGKTDGAS